MIEKINVDKDVLEYIYYKFDIPEYMRVSFDEEIILAEIADIGSYDYRYNYMVMNTNSDHKFRLQFNHFVGTDGTYTIKIHRYTLDDIKHNLEYPSEIGKYISINKNDVITNGGEDIVYFINNKIGREEFLPSKICKYTYNKLFLNTKFDIYGPYHRCDFNYVDKDEEFYNDCEFITYNYYGSSGRLSQDEYNREVKLNKRNLILSQLK